MANREFNLFVCSVTLQKYENNKTESACYLENQAVTPPIFSRDALSDHVDRRKMTLKCLDAIPGIRNFNIYAYFVCLL